MKQVREVHPDQACVACSANRSKVMVIHPDDCDEQ